MNSLKEHFATEWAAMTVNDWIGTILTVVIAILMVVLYVYVLAPKNRDRFESMRDIPFDEDKPDSGENDGGKKPFSR